MSSNRRSFIVDISAAAAGLALVGRADAGNASPGQPAVSGADPAAGPNAELSKGSQSDPFPRHDPTVVNSPPPATMGRQMGCVVTPTISPLGYEMDGDVKVFELISQPVEIDVVSTLSAEASNHQHLIPHEHERFRPRPTSAKRMLAWGFNGTSPGPTLEATEGDRVRIVHRNELPEPTSIHWHGFEIPFAQDGAAGYESFHARRPLLPGHTEEYEFQLIQSGTLMYHTGFNLMKQEGLGLGGAFVVHPETQERPIDRDYVLLMQQWTCRPGNRNPDVTSMAPSHATFNGKAAPEFPMLYAKQGERVRIRLANLSLQYHPIHLHGHNFEIVGTTGGPIQPSARWREATVTVGPGETRDIELVAWNPGTWRLHCHNLHHIMNQMTNQPMGVAAAEGMFTHLHVEPSNPYHDPRDPDANWTYPPKKERI